MKPFWKSNPNYGSYRRVQKLGAFRKWVSQNRSEHKTVEERFRKENENMDRTLIYSHGKVVGHVQDGYLRKHLNSKKHFLRRPPAICFDAQTLLDAEKSGAERIAVKDENEKWHICFIEVLRKKGFTFDRGHGVQVALRMEWWRDCAREAENLLAEINRPKPVEQPKARQEEMFA